MNYLISYQRYLFQFQVGRKQDLDHNWRSTCNKNKFEKRIFILRVYILRRWVSLLNYLGFLIIWCRVQLCFYTFSFTFLIFLLPSLLFISTVVKCYWCENIHIYFFCSVISILKDVWKQRWRELLFFHL